MAPPEDISPHVYRKQAPSAKEAGAPKCQIINRLIADAHGTAVLLAVAETGMPESTFPATCPWSFDQIIGDVFCPNPETN